MLRGSRNIVITCHLSPDGDALGSSLGLKKVIANVNPNAQVTVITPDEPTKSLSFLPGYREIVPLSRVGRKVETIIRKADLIVCLDYNQLYRIDLLAPYIESSQALKLHIDHHIDPELFADVMFSYPEKPATCMLLFELLVSCGLKTYINAEAANCLLAGMMTDTGDFSYNLGDTNIYSVIGELIELGADKARLTRILFQTFSESNLRIQGFALSEKMEVFKEFNVALISLTRDELNRFDYKKGDTEGLVNKPLSIPGILYSAYFREETDYIKVSMRSLGDLPVNEICSRHFEGGGHLNAAGGEFHGSMEECIERFKSLFEDNIIKYIEPSETNRQILEEENL